MFERRQDPRVPVNVPVALAIGDEELEGVMMNVSEKGMFIKMGHKLAKGDSMKVRFVLRGGEEPCAAEGRVAWCGEFGVGVDLWWVNDEFRTFVTRLALVASSPKSKKSMLDSILYPPTIEIEPASR